MNKYAIPALIEILLAAKTRLDRYPGCMRGQAKETVNALSSGGDFAVTGLLGALKDPDRRIRFNAIVALSELGAGPTIALPSLIRGLEDEDPWVQCEVCHVLATMGSEAWSALPALENTGRHAHQLASIAAQYAISRIKARSAESSPSAIQALIKALRHRNWMVRTKAAQILGWLGVDAQPGVPALIEALKDPKIDTCLAAVRALAEIAKAEPSIVQGLVDAVPAGHPSSKFVPMVVKEIGEGAKAAIPYLLLLLRDADSEVRVHATIALSSVGNDARQAVPPLLSVLKHANADACCADLVEHEIRVAIEALGRITCENDEEVISALFRAARHPNDRMRLEAVRSLNRLRPGRLTHTWMQPKQLINPCPVVFCRQRTTRDCTAAVAMITGVAYELISGEISKRVRSNRITSRDLIPVLEELSRKKWRARQSLFSRLRVRDLQLPERPVLVSIRRPWRFRKGHCFVLYQGIVHDPAMNHATTLGEYPGRSWQVHNILEEA